MNTRLCDFRTATGQKLLDRAAQETNLSHTSLKHLKWFVVASLNYAKQVDALQCDGNPMEYTRVPRTGQETPETIAYSLTDINTMLEKLSTEPTACAVIATAAFTGLRRSELRGLRWEDFQGNQLFVSRTVWNTTERGKTKTASSKAPVPILPVLAKLLATHRHAFPSDGYIFAGEKMGRPLNLANLARRVIVPKLRKTGYNGWRGWQGFRRGLATNLYELGVAETTIQAILRHANVETTRRHYIKRLVVPEASRKAMQRLENTFLKMQKLGRSTRRVGTGTIELGTNVGTSRLATKHQNRIDHA